MPRRARWLAQDDAQGLVEYAVILALTSLGMILALMLLRDSISSPVQGSSNQLDGLTAESRWRNSLGRRRSRRARGRRSAGPPRPRQRPGQQRPG